MWCTYWCHCCEVRCDIIFHVHVLLIILRAATQSYESIFMNLRVTLYIMFPSGYSPQKFIYQARWFCHCQKYHVWILTFVIPLSTTCKYFCMISLNFNFIFGNKNKSHESRSRWERRWREWRHFLYLAMNCWTYEVVWACELP